MYQNYNDPVSQQVLPSTSFERGSGVTFGTWRDVSRGNKPNFLLLFFFLFLLWFFWVCVFFCCVSIGGQSRLLCYSEELFLEKYVRII